MSRFRNDPIGAFKRELKECTRISKFYDNPTPFVLSSRLIEWLREPPEQDGPSARAIIILEKVYDGREPYAAAFHNLDSSMDEGHHRCWLKVFVVLLQMADDGSFARFIHLFWQAEISDIQLSHIFLQSADLFHIIQTTNFYLPEDCQQAVNYFLHLARQLSTSTGINMHPKRHLESHTILPITAKDIIDSGGQSNVFRIEVPHECISGDLVAHLSSLKREAITDENYPDGKSLYYEFALKKIAKKEDWEREVDAHRALQASGTTGVVQCLGSWEVQKPDQTTDYYLLMEFGTADLNQYFRSFPPPNLAQDIYDFWRSLSSVIPALSHIHNLSITTGRSTTMLYYGWHGDIKPANILYCDDGIKLTDPGWAQIVLRDDAQRDEKGFPVVVLRGGTASYGGPERIDAETKKIDSSRPVTQRFDIWSLACVFLEAATWVVLGIRGVNQFRTTRKMAHKRDSSSDLDNGDDCFHVSGHESFVIGEWIEYLQRSIRSEDFVTAHILNIIKVEMLLLSPHNRIASVVLARRFDGALRMCEDAIANLPRYSFPPMFEPAFEREQEEAAKVWENPQMKPSVKPMLNRSVRFVQPRGPLVGEVNGTWAPNPRVSGSHLNLPTAQSYHSQVTQYTPQPQYTQPTQSTQYGAPAPYNSPTQYTSAQWSSAAVASTVSIGTQPSRSPVRTPTRDSTHTIPRATQEEKQRVFGYYAALDLLITRRWVYNSTLEHPDASRQKPQAPNDARDSKGRYNVGPGLNPNDPIGKANTWGIGIGRSNSMRREQNRNGYASALSQVYHRFKTTNKTKATKKDTRGPSASNPRLAAENIQTMQPDTDFGALFNDRDIIFLCDNSSTMGRHWPQIHNILPMLMAMMYGQDEDGVDLFFTSSTKGHLRLTEPWEVIEPLKANDPRDRKSTSQNDPSVKDPDDIYKVLAHIMSMIGPDEKYKKKVTIVILTDGKWPKTNKTIVAQTISNWLNRQATLVDGAVDAILNERYYSIQFVQFGDDPEGTEALRYLDDDLASVYNVPDVIDVEPAGGDVLKMIMGSLDDIWDEKGQNAEDSSSPTPEGSSIRPTPPPNSPPAAPLQRQYLNKDTRTMTESTYNSGGRGGYGPEPIYEDAPHQSDYTLHSQYAPQPNPQPLYGGQQTHSQRVTPPAPPQGPSYAGLGMPFHQTPYAPRPQHPQPSQPPRRPTVPDPRLGLHSPPQGNPSRPQRRDTRQ